MSRTSLAIAAALFVAAGCSKSAGNQDTGTKTVPDQEMVAVPGGTTAPQMRAAGGGNDIGMKGGGETPSGGAASDDPFRLQPSEGSLSIEIPASAKAGTEVIAKVLVTPVGPYKINKEFPTKLVLQANEVVTIAKPSQTAGGHDQVKGDADAFEDKQLAFTVKLTPSLAGNHTVNGTFKFAVCDKDTCLAKKETISIAVAAN